MFRQFIRTAVLTVSFLVLLWDQCQAEDWLRFRGPFGAGISESSAPVEWDNSRNMVWKTELPGPGHSCPIIVGNRVFLTCWTGYGTDRNDVGKQENLRRHLLCINRTDGKIVWDREMPAVLPEDDYARMFAEHGYTTHTPVSDGEHVFVFYGKSGVLAYDLEGNQKWKTSVGTDLNQMRWGSSSSPILHDDKVIVPAGMECGAIVALDKKTGQEIWKTPAGSFLGSTWSTPLMVKNPEGRQDLVILVPGEVWGLNPDNGKLRWYVEMGQERSACGSAIANDGTVIAAGESNGMIAFKAIGEKGNAVDAANVLWKSPTRARIPTPVLFSNRVYMINGGVVTCVNAESGERIYAERLQAPTSAPGDSPPQSANSGGDRGNRAEPSGQGRGTRGRGGFGGGRGGRGSDYSSPVVLGDKLYYVSRSGVAYVLQTGDEFKQVATNTFEEGGDFSASPAAADGQLFVRSTRYLYCIGEKQ